ncbi:MAG TPA: PQQ-binding-like beta-propeller repeat protein [Steroidobacteraceae bacterium]|nr:PQQ-binding-like beta-propeller repeat protein [Steroidobacteraceae bacterium]
MTASRRPLWLALIAATGFGFGVGNLSLAQEGGAVAHAPPPAPALAPGVSFTSAQSSAGEGLYAQSCASCHGAQLTDGRFGPPLRGEDFAGHWSGRSLGELFDFLKGAMPPGKPGSLSDEAYGQLIAYLLAQNGVAAGASNLPADGAALRSVRFPGVAAVPVGPGGRLAADATLPPWPVAPNPLDTFTPVTETMLQHPAPGDWLTWRRDYADSGFSPLTQITRGNVANLRLAWSLSLPPGNDEATPLEHDGVMFVYGPSNLILALNAATGAELWRYHRALPKGAFPANVRNIALYGDKLYFGTDDGHVVALYATNGRVAWDQPLLDGPRWRVSGGPLVAENVVMEGVAGNGPGGDYIAGFDAQTGQRLWTLHDIAQEGDPNGRTWNDTPLPKRNGGSIWTAGSYDPQLKLAFFGTGNTYDTAPLLHPVKKPGVSNAGLYLDSTLAVDPKTGRLVWFHQYLPDDQWDFDYAFERQIIPLTINGQSRTLVVTAGKISIYEAVDADTGKFEFAYDLGIQNFIKSINPRTGAKTIDMSKYPDKDHPITVCPHPGGGREWTPGSYNPQSHTVYLPLNEFCMELTPTPKGRPASLSSGVSWSLKPRADSDGRYGRVQAVNLQTRQTLWKTRQRAPFTTGALDTAGGVVFAGSLDRSFSAYDDATGAQLWHTSLDDVPNAAPISFMADGHQYIAVIVGFGGPGESTFPVMLPEIKYPATPSASIWVFELPR